MRDLADSVWRSVISSNTIPTFLHVLGFFEIPYRVETHWNTIFYPIGLAYRTEIVSSGVLFLMFWDLKSQNLSLLDVILRWHPDKKSECDLWRSWFWDLWCDDVSVVSNLMSSGDDIRVMWWDGDVMWCEMWWHDVIMSSHHVMWWCWDCVISWKVYFLKCWDFRK